MYSWSRATPPRMWGVWRTFEPSIKVASRLLSPSSLGSRSKLAVYGLTPAEPEDDQPGKSDGTLAEHNVETLTRNRADQLRQTVPQPVQHHHRQICTKHRAVEPEAGGSTFAEHDASQNGCPRAVAHW